MLNILIADDHFAVRLGLEMLVQDSVDEPTKIDFATNGLEVIEKLKDHQYQILLTDLSMPGLEGLQLITTALSMKPKLRVLVISVSSEEFYAGKCVEAGAYGFVHKGSNDDELKNAILSVIKGEKYVSENQKQFMVSRRIRKKQKDNPFNILSSRELEVLNHLLKGENVVDVAATMSISQSTASTFKARIFKKLEVNSIVETLKLAELHGLVHNNSVK